MNLFAFPTKTLLSKYQLNEYIAISEACQQGDMQKFEENLKLHMDYFVHGGVYMVVEKLRTLTFRNLVKKVALVVQQEPDFQANGKPHIKIDLLLSILRKWDDLLDLDEVECMLANLIY